MSKDPNSKSHDLLKKEDSSAGGRDMDRLLSWFSEKLSIGLGSTNMREKPKILSEMTLEGVAEFIKAGKCGKVITMAGAGISTAAGIPDFRSPGNGLYSKLQSYNLPYPEAVFEIDYFRTHPEPFFALAKELYPGSYKPTTCHYFLRLLSDKGLLLRHYTQNVDTLEHVAGVPTDKVVEAHGTFRTSHCMNQTCNKEYTLDWMKESLFKDTVPRCVECNSVVKPDVVFFGESLPERFGQSVQQDFSQCELLIILGTSLVVQPFASLVDRVPPTCPRLLINREKAGSQDHLTVVLGFGCGFDFDSADNFRDVAWIGDCDEGCRLLAQKLGWEDELDLLMREGLQTPEEQLKKSGAGKEQDKDDKKEL